MTLSDIGRVAYTCALQREILAQGRLFVTNRRLCFHANIIGWVTNFALSLEDVVAVDKKSTAVVIPNSIQVCTLHGRYLLTSFLWRDEAYDLVRRNWQYCLGLRQGQTPLMIGKQCSPVRTELADSKTMQVVDGSQDSSKAGDEQAQEDAGVEGGLLDVEDESSVKSPRFMVGRPIGDLGFEGREPAWLLSCYVRDTREKQKADGVLAIEGRLDRQWSHGSTVDIERRAVYDGEHQKLWEYHFLLTGLLGSHSAQVLMRINARRPNPSIIDRCDVALSCRFSPPAPVWFQRTIDGELRQWCRLLMAEAQKTLQSPGSPDAQASPDSIPDAGNGQMHWRLGMMVLMALVLPHGLWRMQARWQGRAGLIDPMALDDDFANAGRTLWRREEELVGRIRNVASRIHADRGNHE